ncbi:hypothetical protein BGZ63DRAFT_385844 [Mariannaea sp. PMI_226]|nr:hypothetical protein BGZ63DRAFT_385844 [Mariannaea sp. PMI_226]
MREPEAHQPRNLAKPGQDLPGWAFGQSGLTGSSGGPAHRPEDCESHHFVARRRTVRPVNHGGVATLGAVGSGSRTANRPMLSPRNCLEHTI